jgi:UDP-3-O-[3-hydroxymyristoyl] N-acetylglucosamine deacetylase
VSILNQKTVKKPIQVNGLGLHTGLEVRMKILPSDPNTGILFKRIDLKNNNIVIPSVFNVTNTNHCTTVSNEFGVKVSTIEHLMAAMYGLGVDNALIEINSEEIPILDGSAKNFVDLFLENGFEVSQLPIKLIKIEKNLSVKQGQKYISIDKSKVSLDIDFEIKYSNPVIGTQRNRINVYEQDLKDIYNSRTFCLYEDVEKLRQMGLAKGGSLDNAIVVKNKKILNEDGLRNELEFVNHKILDCIGDLYLAGYKIIGSIKCSQGGHSLTNQLLREVLKNKSNYSVLELKEKTLPHTFISKSQLKSIA